MKYLNVGRISLLLEMIFYNHKVCTIISYFLETMLNWKNKKREILIDSHCKKLGSIFWYIKLYKYFLMYPQGEDAISNNRYIHKNKSEN